MEIGRKPLDKIKCKRHNEAKKDTELMGTGKIPQNR
jgi:hypothetical protein